MAGIVASAALVIPSLACAQQASLKTQPGIEVGLSGSYYHYKEPSIAVTEEGYKGGIDLVLTAPPRNDWFMQVDGRFAYGRNDYTGAGNKGGNPDWYTEFRGTLGKDFERDGYSFSPYSGIGFRYLFNDLRGQTSTGALGYRRESRYVYIPIGVTHRLRLESSAKLSTTLEFDYLVKGWQKSNLTDASTFLPDQTNKQHSGFGVRASMYYEKANWLFGPWFHYWRIDQSETTSTTVTVSGSTFRALIFEPKNRTVEIGVRLGYRF
ncbi:MAG: hypothetical protein OEZ08_09025 [Betaproteobacteria bacterium]|nr:hypothetical protein [Betaproteobacteria bacterium]